MTESNWPNANHNSDDVTDIEYEQLVTPYTANGIIGTSSDTTFAFGDSASRAIKVRSGKFALVRGQLYSSGADDVSVAVAANSSGSTRIDLVVLRWDRSALTVRAAVVTGTPGAGAPSATQETGSTGTWELPIATVKVGNGVTVINDSDVTRLYWYLAPQPINCTSKTRPPHAPGQRIWESDTGDEYISNGSSWTNPAEDTGWITCPVSPGWAQQSSIIRRINGVCFLRFEATRTSSDIPASTETQCGTVPSGFVPSRNICMVGYFDGANEVRGFVNEDGRITINNFGRLIVTGSRANKDLDVQDNQPFPKGSTVSFHTTAYPLG